MTAMDGFIPAPGKRRATATGGSHPAFTLVGAIRDRGSFFLAPVFLAAFFFAFALCPLPLDAQQDDDFTLNAASAVLIDAATGVVLFEKNPDEPISPASLTKLMTMHLALHEAVRRGISLDERVEVPEESWWRNQPPRSSLMFLEEGQKASLRELLLGLSIPSGNDAAVAVALRFAPTVDDFAALMNKEARDFGLTQTTFVEPSGIDENNMTTALEFAKLSREYLRLNPGVIRDYHTVEEFVYPTSENMPDELRHSPPKRTHRNHVGLLGYDNRPPYPGADGLKTGYIDEAGYNLAATAEREGTRFIAVILGVPANSGAYWGPRLRENDAAALFDRAFANYKTLHIEYPAIAPARVWKGKHSTIDVLPVIPNQDSRTLGAFTVSITRGENVYYEIEMIKGLTAPLPEGSNAGSLILSDDAGEIARVPLLTASPVEQAHIFKRIWDAIVMFFSGIKRNEE
jgi:D-alanyl-D-alanine carboxypeptidase (penicillin-binding protein 5/6)